MVLPSAMVRGLSVSSLRCGEGRRSLSPLLYSQNTPETISEGLNFKIFLGGYAPRPPYISAAFGSSPGYTKGQAHPIPKAVNRPSLCLLYFSRLATALLGECLAFGASGSDPTISIRYIRVCSTGEWLVPLYLICTRHIQTC